MAIEPTSSIEELSPSYLGEQRITLSVLTDPTALLAHHPIELSVSYDRVGENGLVLPLVLIIQGPSSGSYQRKVFRRAQPGSIVFTPREGGRHLVRLAEVAHNRWWGSAKLTVQGDQLEVIRPV